MYERWCDGSLGDDLLFQARAQCMDVNERNYRWSESRSKVCQMCDMGEGVLVEHKDFPSWRMWCLSAKSMKETGWR